MQATQQANQQQAAQPAKDVSIGIIGGGMSGMLMAVKLLRAGKTNFKLFEKAKKVGGVWRENRYPGVACDVASFAYCYEFEPKADWSRRFSEGAEIQAYFESVAKKYQLDKYAEFETSVASAKFIDQQWHVTTDKGDTHQFDMLVDATGPLNKKLYPSIEGLDSFAGKLVHTADWDDDYDYSGKRIGLLGSGSSGVQATAPLAEKAAHLTTFIRTPQWVMPTPNPYYGSFSRYLKRKVPLLGTLTRKFYDWVGEMFGRASLYDGWQRKMVNWAVENNLNSIKDETLREKLRPDFQPMCRRMIVSETYYPALQRDNVHVERADIERIEPNGIRTKDGQLHELDMLVLATGFKPNQWGVSDITGPNGEKLTDIWQDEFTRNYRSISVPKLPNFFVLIGTNSPITNLSLIDIADIGVEYVLQCMRHIEQGKFTTMTPKQAAATQFGSELATSFDGTAWVSGCTGWYTNGSELPQTWPWLPAKFRDDLREPELSDYELV
ncbi:MAG: NAD(P)/FAD-dependent oxidoreductase [Pseudomonadales bacterium]|nr:NAD(P)/FAD-dependent oxidoreductase [Pseudomonadales bacterium]